MLFNRATSGIVFVLSIVLFFALVTYAEPDGATVEYVSNTTKNVTPPTARTDNKGTITTVLISTVQQNQRWKAYVGNVSGTLVLQDAESYSIYEWSTGGSPDGKIFISRNNSIDWNRIGCANLTSITNEQTILGHGAASADNIQNTFSDQIHESFLVGTLGIPNSSCYSTLTWVNDTQQTATENSLFQEVLLMDNSTMNLIFVAFIDQDSSSYRNDLDSTNTTYDFQAIVPDYTSSLIATYYFYVEINT